MISGSSSSGEKGKGRRRDKHISRRHSTHVEPQHVQPPIVVPHGSPNWLTTSSLPKNNSQPYPSTSSHSESSSHLTIARSPSQSPTRSPLSMKPTHSPASTLRQRTTSPQMQAISDPIQHNIEIRTNKKTKTPPKTTITYSDGTKIVTTGDIKLTSSPTPRSLTNRSSSTEFKPGHIGHKRSSLDTLDTFDPLPPPDSRSSATSKTSTSYGTSLFDYTRGLHQSPLLRDVSEQSSTPDASPKTATHSSIFSPTPSPPPYQYDNSNITAQPDLITSIDDLTKITNLTNSALKFKAASGTNQPDHQAPNESKILDVSHKYDDSTTPDEDAEEQKSYRVIIRNLTLIFLLFVTKFLIAFIGGASNAINAMMVPSNSKPDKIGPEWWDSMDDLIKVESILYVLFSLSVNFLYALESFPSAARVLRKDLFRKNQTPLQIAENTTTVILAGSAATASAAIAYNAFSWTLSEIEDIVTVAALVINFTTRYVGCKDLIKRTRGYFYSDIQLVRTLEHDLKNIDDEYMGIVEERYQEALRVTEGKFTEQTLQIFTEKLIVEIEKNPDLLQKENFKTTLLAYSSAATKVTVACAVGVLTFPTFTQKGFDGFAKIIGLFPNGDGALDHLPAGVRGLIGGLPGLATSMLYTLSCLDFPAVTGSVLKQLYNKPEITWLLMFAYLGVANFCASASMENVAVNVLDHEDRIFDFLTAYNLMGLACIYGGRLGAGITNSNAALRKVYSIPFNEKNPTLQTDMPKFLQTLDPNNLPSKETVITLKAFSEIAHPKKAQRLIATRDSEEYDVIEGSIDDPSTSVGKRNSLQVVSNVRPTVSVSTSLGNLLTSVTSSMSRSNKAKKSLKIISTENDATHYQNYGTTYQP
jgi:hypothetical protein